MGRTQSGLPGVYNSSPITLANGDGAAVALDSNGNTIVVGTGTFAVQSAASVTGGYSFLNIPAGQATTVVKVSAGTLHSIILNSAATATNTTVVYDNASGAGMVIGRPAVTTATVPTTLIYDIAFANGLTIITATANGGDMTVCFK